MLLDEENSLFKKKTKINFMLNSESKGYSVKENTTKYISHKTTKTITTI